MKKKETTRTMAERWNLTERRVSEMCSNGTIHGAVKKGRSWQIPADTEKPIDRRIKNGTYRKQEIQPQGSLPLPIGVSDYRGGYEKEKRGPLFEFRKRKKAAFYWDQRKRGLSRMPFVNIPQPRYIAVFRHSWLCFFSAVLVA